MLIQIGINDIKYLVERVEKDSSYDVDNYLENAVNNLKQSIEKLIANNAKKIVINNVFDLSKAPIYSKRSEKTISDVINFVNEYNLRLNNMVVTIGNSYPDKLKLFDFYGEFNTLTSQFLQEQINIKDPALSSVEHQQLLLDVLNSDNNSEIDISKIDDYLFLDDIHPNRIVHEIIANKIYDLLLQWF